MIDTSTLQPKEIEYLKFLKGKWLDATESFKKLENARTQWRFWETQETTEKPWIFKWALNQANTIRKGIWEWAFKLWADISKIKRGTFEDEAAWVEPIDSWIEKWFLWKTISAWIDRADTFSARKQAQWDIGQTGLEKGLDKVWGWFWVVSDVIGQWVSSIASTVTDDKQKEAFKTAVWALWGSKAGQYVWEQAGVAKEAFGKFEEQSPRLASQFRNIWSTWEVLADVVWWGVAKQWVKKTWGFLWNTADVVWDVANKAWDIGKQTAQTVSDAAVKLWGKTKEVSSKIPTGKTTLTRSIPESVIRKDLWFTPTERAKIEKIVWKTESQYILEKGLAGKWKEELAATFAKQADDAYNTLNSKLKTATTTRVKSDKATEALEDILESLTSSKKLEKWYAKDIKAVKEMLEKPDYSLEDLNNIRRSFDKVNTGMYTAKWTVKSWVETVLDVDIRNSINNTLQKEALKAWVDVKAINQELRVWIEMKDALLRRLSQEEKNNFIWLQDIWVSAILSWGNPVWAIAMIWAKKYWESLVPSISQKLYNLNKTKDVSSRMSRGNPITPRNKSSRLGLASDTRSNLVQSPVKKQLALPQNSVVPKKAIVTPQTVEKGVIAESKKWLEKAKITTPSKKKLAPTKATKKEAPKKTTSEKPKVEKKLAPKKTGGKKYKSISSHDRSGSSVAKKVWMKKEEVALLKRVEDAQAKLSNEEQRFVSFEDAQIYIDLVDEEKWIKWTLEKIEKIEQELNPREIELFQKKNPWIWILTEPRHKTSPNKITVAKDWTLEIRNPQGFINPTAIWKDVSKALSNLTPKNIYFTANTIGKKLWVEVKKVQAILKEYVAKYGEELKWKTGELFDELADKLWVRAKLMGNDWAMKEVGKIDDIDIPSYLRNYKEDIKSLNNASSDSEIIKIVNKLWIEWQWEVFADFPILEKKYINSQKNIVTEKLPPIGRTETGKPVKAAVYFGRNKDYSEISSKNSNKWSGTWVWKWHMFFSSDNQIAETYWKYVKEAELDIKNPLVIDAKGMNWNDIKFEWKSKDINNIAKIAEAKWYDSLIVNNVRDSWPLSNKPAWFKTSTSVAIFDEKIARLKKAYRIKY